MEPLARAPLSYRQLCAIAADVLGADRSIDDGEWAEQIKRRLVALGFAYPRPDALTEAMRVIERLKVREWGPRPIPRPTSAPLVARPADVAPPVHGSPWQLPRSGPGSGWTLAIGSTESQPDLTAKLETGAPAALVAIRRAVQSPEVRAAVARARRRDRDERAQPRPLSRGAVLTLQAIVLRTRAALDALRSRGPAAPELEEQADARRDV